jgi:streptogramin lyase
VNVSSIYEKIAVNDLVSALSLQDGAYLNGTAGNTSDALSSPFGITVGTDDSLFISEYRNAWVTRLPVNSLIGSVVAGTEIVGNSSSQLNGPSHLYADVASNIYVSDTTNKRAMFWANGSSAGVSVTSTTVINSRIIGIAVDSQKNIYISEVDNHRITRWNPGATSGVNGTTANLLDGPAGMALSQNETYLYISDLNNNRIQRFELI